MKILQTECDLSDSLDILSAYVVNIEIAVFNVYLRFLRVQSSPCLCPVNPMKTLVFVISAISQDIFASDGNDLQK